MKGWTKIYMTRDYTRANIIKGMLEENSVAVVILNKLDSSYVNFGDLEIFVPEHHVEIARKLIDNDQLN